MCASMSCTYVHYDHVCACCIDALHWYVCLYVHAYVGACNVNVGLCTDCMGICTNMSTYVSICR